MEKGHEIWYMESKEPHTTVARELQKYKLNLVGVHDARWDKGGIVRGDFFLWKMEL